jgi:DNA-binding MarR family transcriptional regulator
MKSARTPLVSPLHTHLGFWLRYVSNHVSARFSALLDAQGVTVTEWVALRTLYAEPAVTHAGLIDALGMTKGAASKVISRLEEKGLAQRALADGRAREQVLALTPAGRQLVPRLAALADANDEHFFGELATAEREGLAALLQELVQRHQLREPPLG